MQEEAVPGPAVSPEAPTSEAQTAVQLQDSFQQTLPQARDAGLQTDPSAADTGVQCSPIRATQQTAAQAMPPPAQAAVGMQTDAAMKEQQVQTDEGHQSQHLVTQVILRRTIAAHSALCMQLNLSWGLCAACCAVCLSRRVAGPAWLMTFVSTVHGHKVPSCRVWLTRPIIIWAAWPMSSVQLSPGQGCHQACVGGIAGTGLHEPSTFNKGVTAVSGCI